MAYALILCVFLQVCQINMTPLDSVENTSEMSKLSLNPMRETTGIVKRLFQPNEKAANVNIMPSSLKESSKVFLSRVKREMLKSTGCPKGHAKMWKGGRCVTCDVYMDHMDTDECPGDSLR